MDARLAEIAEQLDGARLAAELFDPEWRLVWVSGELKTLLDERDEGRLGLGRHALEARTNDLWTSRTTQASRRSWTEANLGYILAETPPEVLEEVAAAGGDLQRDPGLPPGLEPGPAPLSWSYEVVYRRPGFQPMAISCIAIRIHDDAGEVVGTANAYSPALSSSILDLLARGDERMFERMSRLMEPGRREAAILFADLQASGTLSRRLSSAAYFRLISDLTTAIDGVVGEHGGVVGKHAGDGVTAFFLASELGSESAAARAAIEAAREIAAAAAALGDFEPEEVRMNVGLHWSGALYMGQVVTGGRLEVTALGDEVNECARIQHCARDGAALASKAVLERLRPEDAGIIGVDPDAISYRTIAELSHADGKAIRDAGGVAVAELPPTG